MTQVEQLGAFAARATYADLSGPARRELAIGVLDALGCAIGALGAAAMAMLKAHADDFGGRPLATLIGGHRTAPDRAAFFNAALVRYLDFNDSFLAAGETCHPSDNLGAVLAASEYAGASGPMSSSAAASPRRCPAAWRSRSGMAASCAPRRWTTRGSPPGRCPGTGRRPNSSSLPRRMPSRGCAGR